MVPEILPRAESRVAREVIWSIVALNGVLLLYAVPDYRVAIDAGYHISLAAVRRARRGLVGSYQFRAGRPAQPSRPRFAGRDCSARSAIRRRSARVYPRQRAPRFTSVVRRTSYGHVFRPAPGWRFRGLVRGRDARGQRLCLRVICDRNTLRMAFHLDSLGHLFLPGGATYSRDAGNHAVLLHASRWLRHCAGRNYNRGYPCPQMASAARRRSRHRAADLALLDSLSPQSCLVSGPAWPRSP